MDSKDDSTIETIEVNTTVEIRKEDTTVETVKEDTTVEPIKKDTTVEPIRKDTPIKIIKEICQGHRVCYDVNLSVNDIAERKTWPFKKFYDTHCKILPTSWSFEMLFQHLPDNGNISCYITLCRTDTVNIPVKAFIWMRFSTANDQPFFVLPKILRNDRLLPNDQIKESLVDILPFPDADNSLSQELAVAVVIRIRDCHLKSNVDPLTTECADA